MCSFWSNFKIILKNKFFSEILLTQIFQKNYSGIVIKGANKASKQDSNERRTRDYDYCSRYRKQNDKDGNIGV